MFVQVVIIGGGPSGLLLAAKLAARGIDVIVLEQRTRKYVLSRIRAGVLETGTVNQLVEIGAGKNLLQNGLKHNGVFIATDDDMFHIDFKESIDKQVTVYGQTEVTKDLYELLDRRNIPIIHEAKVEKILDHTSSRPTVVYENNGQTQSVQCEFVIGCDGFHGISNKIIKRNQENPYLIQLPYGWLGILSETPPVEDELIYSRSSMGFALASMRSKSLSRYYVQVPPGENVGNWSDARFWESFKLRIPEHVRSNLITGPSIEKSIAPLRSYVANTMQEGHLLLCGDAAHIVPPTGAKGLNLAASDVYYAHEALVSYFFNNQLDKINEYSNKALMRVWKSMRFSWWMTRMFHHDPNQNPFEEKIGESELNHLKDSKLMQSVFSDNYTGLPY